MPKKIRTRSAGSIIDWAVHELRVGVLECRSLGDALGDKYALHVENNRQILFVKARRDNFPYDFPTKTTPPKINPKARLDTRTKLIFDTLDSVRHELDADSENDEPIKTFLRKTREPASELVEAVEAFRVIDAARKKESARKEKELAEDTEPEANMELCLKRVLSVLQGTARAFNSTGVIQAAFCEEETVLASFSDKTSAPIRLKISPKPGKNSEEDNFYCAVKLIDERTAQDLIHIGSLAAYVSKLVIKKFGTVRDFL
jgi:hypothetical protein